MSEPSDVPDIPRDRWGRPLIPHPETGKIEPYTRASTLSKAIDNSSGLADWKTGKVIEGLRMDPTLLDLEASPKEIAEQALELAGGHLAAEAGTWLHSLTEDIDRGTFMESDLDEDEPGTKRILASLREYQHRTQHLQVLGIELFVANREVMAAGTFDRVVRYKGVSYIADIKTGKDAPRYPHSAAVQMAVYSRGQRWDPVRGWLMPMWEHVDQNRAILIHLPVTGEPRCSLHWVDIAEGNRMARVAAAVKAWRATTPSSPL